MISVDAGVILFAAMGTVCVACGMSGFIGGLGMYHDIQLATLSRPPPIELRWRLVWSVVRPTLLIAFNVSLLGLSNPCAYRYVVDALVSSSNEVFGR